MASIEALVESLIQANKIVLFSKTYCSYCARAKQLLAQLNVQGKYSMETIELDRRSDGSQIQSYLVKKTGQRTVPNIFISQQHVGGCDDLFRKNSSGELKRLLE